MSKQDQGKNDKSPIPSLAQIIRYYDDLAYDDHRVGKKYLMNLLAKYRDLGIASATKDEEVKLTLFF
jgi:hypothetical protein